MAESIQAGRLEERPLPRLLLSLLAARASGTLELHCGAERARIALLGGSPLRCELEGAPSGVIDLLVQAGALAADAAEKARRAVAARGGTEEAALLGLQLVAPRELIAALRNVATRRLVALGRHERGEWKLDPDAAPPAGSGGLRIDPLPLVQAMLVAHWRPDRMLAELTQRDGPYPVRAQGFETLAARLATNGDVAEMVAALDGTRELWGLVGSATDAPRIAALWALDAAGALEWRAAPAPAEAEAAEPEVPAEPQPDIEIVLAGAAAADARQAEAGPRREAQAAPADPKAEVLRQEILEKHAQLGDLDHYALLDVEASAKPAEIKRAYLKAAKRFHPDALARLGLGDVRAQAGEVFAEITRAHATLSDAKKRADYDAELSGEGVDAERIAQAEMLFRKAETLMKMGNFGGALEFAQAAVQLYGDDPAYQAALGWCLYKGSPPDEARARTHLEAALALREEDAVTHLRLGIVLKALGEHALAAKATARARALDPKVRG